MIWPKYFLFTKIIRLVTVIMLLAITSQLIFLPCSRLNIRYNMNRRAQVPINIDENDYSSSQEVDKIFRLLSMHEWRKETFKKVKFLEGTNEFCPEWAQELDWKGPTTKPLIQLDPTRIIYPANRNGPSFELISLQEAIFIGMVTNRTVVIPSFRPLTSDIESIYEIDLPASLRVDLKILSQLVSLTTVDKMQRLCHKSFDIGFQQSDAPCNFCNFLEETSGMSLNSSYKHLFGHDHFTYMRIWSKKYESKCIPPLLPVRRIHFKSSFSLRNIKGQFRSDTPCAVLINTYKSPSKLSRKANQDILQKAMKNLSSVTQEDVYGANLETKYKLIEVFTQRPRYVRELASEFIMEVMKNQAYLALHWGYDFKSECRSHNNFCFESETLGTANLSEAILLAGTKFGVEEVFKDISTNCQTPERVNFYLVAGANDSEEIKHQIEDANFQREFFRKIAKNEYYKDQRCWNIELFNKFDLYRFIISKYPEQKCSAIWQDIHELMDMVENELCKQSEVFIYSPKSVWSEVAMQTRINNLPIWAVFSEIDELTNIS
uniref:uncharacterized protein LOC120332911 n=1 Tax=Styela clava TaxID=7725 RepID=UPI00193A7D81|nr:uncharacterized protein LOC120332911 [Styela clava]